MEQCISLDLYLSPFLQNSAINCTDELNTPVFDVLRDYNVNNNKHVMYSEENPFYFPTRNVKREDDGGTFTNTSIKIDSPETSVVLSNITDGTLSPNKTVMDGVNLEEYDLLNDYNDAVLNDLRRLDETQGTSAFAPSLADVSSSNNNNPIAHHNYALKLNTDLRLAGFTGPGTIHTPDVVNTIYSIERDFNLFRYMEAGVVDQQEILADLKQEPQPSPPISIATSPDHEPTHTTNTSTAQKRIRKRRQYHDDDDYDDDDYVPPTQKKRTSRTETYSSDSSEDSDYEVPQKHRRRGRPAKSASVSSEDNKYREMRDKNNEASRKSRMKRKTQEQTYEQERQGLEDRNIKLKAEVSELERTVNTFRNNLMQLLLKK